MRWSLIAAVAAFVVVLAGPAAYAAGEAPGAPGGGSSWSSGDKLGIGTATGSASKVWYTVADGITTEVFYPRADVPDVQDLQYVVTDGSSFTDLERDATTHAV